MIRDARAARRAGFTLVELLVVIAILALLAALIAAGIARVKEGTQSTVTNQTLIKLQKALDTQWKVTCDKCRDDRRKFEKKQTTAPEFAGVFQFCEGDVDRAEAVWMYLNLRRDLPQTFAEANSNVTLVDPTTNTAIVSLTPPATYRQVPAAGGTPSEQSAALLYLILTRGGRGSNFSLEDAMQGAQFTIPSLNMPGFKDAFGTEVAFVRFYESDEVNAPPFVRARPGIKNPLNDPLDPVGRIALWNSANKRIALQTALSSPGVSITINGRNRLATVVAAGPDKTFDLSGTTDDQFGYRLTREGNRGD